MKRYLLDISYIGTSFRGIQRNPIKGALSKYSLETVQGCIEYGLTRAFKPENLIKLILSSRTDSGVHALQSTVHVDLETPIISPMAITTILNRQFLKYEIPIRVINTIHVPETFHCRYHAKARTYLYRIAVSKIPLKDPEELKIRRTCAFIPIEETQRCYFLQNPNFDIEKLKDIAPMFLGRHDFRTFMGINGDIKKKNAFFCVREMNEIRIEESKSLAMPPNAEKANELYNYWNIFITGRSFLYKQVRRMVGVLIYCAYNEIQKKDVYEMITIPSKHSWNSKIHTIPAHGLYLCKVHYDQKDLQFENETKNDTDKN